MSIDVAELTSELEEFFDRQNNAYQESEENGQATQTKKRTGRGGALETFGTDLTLVRSG